LLRREAHTLVSLAGNFGCTKLMNCSCDVMQATPHERADVAALVAGLKSAANRAVAAMEERHSLDSR
jgi:hypothetical protein